MKGYIYKITNKTNGKFYIGSTFNFEKRIHTHFYNLKCGKHHSFHLQNAFKKYGESSFEVSCKEIIVETEQELRNIEERYIRFCWNSGKLYNVSKQGSGGDLVSYHPKNKEIRELQHKLVTERYANMAKEEKDKISERMKGEKNPNYGNKWSNEMRERASNFWREYYQKHTPFFLGKTFEEIFGEEEAKKKKERMSEIGKQKTGDKNPFYGKHHSDETKKLISEKHKGSKPTNAKKVSYNGVIYESAMDCAKVLGIPMVTVAYRCRNNIYGFSYVGENDMLPQRDAKIHITYEEVEDAVSKCSTRKELQEKYPRAYAWLNLHRDVREKLYNKYLTYIRTYWTLDKVKEIAAKYESYKDFRNNEATAYSAVTRNKWQDEIRKLLER